MEMSTRGVTRGVARSWLTEGHLAALTGLDPLVSDESLVARLDLRPVAWWVWCRAADREAGGPLRVAVRELVAREALVAARLAAVLQALATAGIAPIILKGAALAYTVYPEPWLRPRNDDDLLVAADQFDRARAVMRVLGYTEQAANPGARQTAQCHFTVRGAGKVHHVDLHWHPLVPAAFRGFPTHAELLRTAVALPALGPAAKGPSPVHALLLACAHRVAHHGPTEDPQWLIDVHLLAHALDEEGWTTFCQAAGASRLAAVCRFELQRAVALLGSPVPQAVFDALGRATGEPSARHLAAGGRLHRLWLEFGDLRARERWANLLSRLFPSPAYMRARYGARGPALPLAYAWRATAGTARWIADALVRRGR